MSKTKNEIIWAGRNKEERSLFSFFKRFSRDVRNGMCPPFKPKEFHSCDLIISEECNLRCKKCFAWQHAGEASLSFKECKRIVDDIASVAKRPFEINLGGGEPLIHPWIFKLIKYCRRKGLSPALTTNGTLINSENARKLANAGLARLSISVDSFDKEIYESVSGVPGSFEKMRNGLDLITAEWKKGMLNMHAVLMGINIDQIESLIEYAEGNDVISGIHFQAASQPFYTSIEKDWFRKEEYSFLWPQDAGRMQDLIDKLISLKEKGAKINNPVHQLKMYRMYYEYPERFSRKFRCNLGDSNVTVNSRGIAHLCPFMEGLCDVSENGLSDMWYSHHAAKLRYRMHNCRRSCNNIMNCYFEEENIDAYFGDVSMQADENDAPAIKDDEQIPHIDFCILNITPMCTLRCEHCFIGAEGEKKKRHFDENALTASEWCWVIDELTQLKTEKMNLFFTGGEPMTFPGYERMLRLAADNGFHTMLGASGSEFNKKTIRTLARAGLSFLEVSLDSHLAQAHDFLRSSKGLFDRIMLSCEHLKKISQANIGISCVINNFNYHNMREYLSFVEQNDSFDSLYFHALVQPYDTPPIKDWTRSAEYAFLWPKNTSEISDMFDMLIEISANGCSKIGNSPDQLRMYKEYYLKPYSPREYSECGRDSSMLSINWLGYVNYCECHGPAGSLRDFRLREILLSIAAAERRAMLDSCSVECSSIGCFRYKKGLIDAAG